MPNAQDLHDRSKQIRDHYRKLRTTPLSGHHKNDPQTAARERDGVPHLHEHVIAHHDADDHTFVGKCATRVRAELTTYAGTDVGDDPTDRAAVRAAKKYSTQSVPSDGTLVIRNTDWNAVLHALTARKVGVTAASVNGPCVPAEEPDEDEQDEDEAA